MGLVFESHIPCWWEFDVGNNNTECDNPSHTYDSPGTYTVSLTVSGQGGEDTETKTDYIRVFEPVQADFITSQTSGTAPLLVNFTNQSTGEYDTCAWDFGDGNSSTECDDPEHTYTDAGTYTVSLTISGPGGTDTHTKIDYITILEEGTTYHIFLPLVVR